MVYDAGALLAYERRSKLMTAMHAAILDEGATPLVPVVVLAQAWRGGPQAQLSRMLAGCRVTPDNEEIGRAAGRACAASGTSDVVDAIVVVLALVHGASVVSSDPDDLASIADALNAHLTIEPV